MDPNLRRRTRRTQDKTRWEWSRRTHRQGLGGPELQTDDSTNPIPGGGGLVEPTAEDSVDPNPRRRTQGTQDPMGLDSSNPRSKTRYARTRYGSFDEPKTRWEWTRRTSDEDDDNGHEDDCKQKTSGQSKCTGADAVANKHFIQITVIRSDKHCERWECRPLASDTY